MDSPTQVIANAPLVPPGLSLEQINLGLAHIQTALTHIKLAEQAGLDVSQSKANALDYQERLLKLKNTYFPNQ